MDTAQKVIVIVGTNASGKSGLAIRLAEKYNGEVISADSRQVYKGLDIATGKISQNEMKGVPHHLLDVAAPSETYTAAEFAKDGRVALKDISNRKKLPIIAGGTGFYIDALLNPDSFSSVPPNDELREELEQLSSEELYAGLVKIDPKRAVDIKIKNEQNNTRRLIRAIEIASSPAAESITPEDTPQEVLWIGIQWDKEELKKRIHERTLSRIENGMIDEAKTLHQDGLTFERMETLGLEYRLLAKHLQEKLSEEELIELIDIGDTQYAKQQRTWFKRNEDINWFEGDKLEGVEELVEGFLDNKQG